MQKHMIILCFLLGSSPASELYISTFRNTLSVPSSLPMKMEQIGCSETSVYIIQTPVNYPKKNIQNTAKVWNQEYLNIKNRNSISQSKCYSSLLSNNKEWRQAHTHAPRSHTNMRMLQKTEVEVTALTKLGNNMIQSPYASNTLTPTPITTRWSLSNWAAFAH